MPKRISRSWEKRASKNPEFVSWTQSARFRELMADGNPHTAAQLAQALGVSSKTIRRWLHFFRDDMGMPIETRPKGFILIDTDTVQ